MAGVGVSWPMLQMPELLLCHSDALPCLALPEAWLPACPTPVFRGSRQTSGLWLRCNGVNHRPLSSANQGCHPLWELGAQPRELSSVTEGQGGLLVRNRVPGLTSGQETEGDGGKVGPRGEGGGGGGSPRPQEAACIPLEANIAPYFGALQPPPFWSV